MTNTKSWTDSLAQDVYQRLANCRSLKSDILPLAQAKWAAIKNKKGFTKEDALVAVLELLDSNGAVFGLTQTEYDDILNGII